MKEQYPKLSCPSINHLFCAHCNIYANKQCDINLISSMDSIRKNYMKDLSDLRSKYSKEIAKLMSDSRSQ